jgi:hypothetical protein
MCGLDFLVLKQFMGPLVVHMINIIFASPFKILANSQTEKKSSWHKADILPQPEII